MRSTRSASSSKSFRPCLELNQLERTCISCELAVIPDFSNFTISGSKGLPGQKALLTPPSSKFGLYEKNLDGQRDGQVSQDRAVPACSSNAHLSRSAFPLCSGCGKHSAPLDPLAYVLVLLYRGYHLRRRLDDRQRKIRIPCSYITWDRDWAV